MSWLCVEKMEILKITGNSEVAEIGVARFDGDDRRVVEMVDGLAPPLPRSEKWIINVSTQFGCPVGCPFCDAASAYHGNLSDIQMIHQVKWALDRHPADVDCCRKLKVHFARMGEPSLNDAVLSTLRHLRTMIPNPHLWACVATVAPQGRQAWFEHLLRVKNDLFPGRFQLQFSVQSTSRNHRNRFIPVLHWSLEDIARYGARFHQSIDRKVVLNFALSTESEFDPDVVRRYFDPDQFAIKLTPVNPTESGRINGILTVLRSGCEDMIMERVTGLITDGYDVVLSIGDVREDSIGSNCGQAVRALLHPSGIQNIPDFAG